jgi:hypothetical protein
MDPLLRIGGVADEAWSGERREQNPTGVWRFILIVMRRTRERECVCVASAIHPLANLTFFNEKKKTPTDRRVCVCVGV